MYIEYFPSEMRFTYVKVSIPLRVLRYIFFSFSVWLVVVPWPRYNQNDSVTYQMSYMIIRPFLK